jgi:hypothetical protein
MFVFNRKSTYQIEQRHKENMKYSMHVNVFKAQTIADMLRQPSVMPLLEMFTAEVKYLTILFFFETLFLNYLKHISFYKSVLHWIDQNFESSQRHTQKFYTHC